MYRSYRIGFERFKTLQKDAAGIVALFGEPKRTLKSMTTGSGINPNGTYIDTTVDTMFVNTMAGGMTQVLSQLPRHVLQLPELKSCC